MNSRILTFYSWKGGVGRTMALANVGVQLARKGKRVLLVDWDLEAPGLKEYFSQHGQQGSLLVSISNASDNSGLLGLLSDMMTESPQENKSEAWKSRCARITFLPQQDINKDERPSSDIQLDLIGSGQDNTDYSARLDSFSWSSFFSDHEGAMWLERLRDQWKKEYDFILIDSRTGLTDAGGVCTVQMPDLLVLAFTANTQSLEGGIRFLEGVNEARNIFPYERSQLTIFPLLSRWEGAKEVDLSEQWLERIECSIAPLVESWLPANLPTRRLLERLRVPHVARFSFGEPLPVLTHSLTDPELPGMAYDLLADLIAGPLSDAGSIIEPGYHPALDIENIKASQLDELIKDQDSRLSEISSLNKIYGPNSRELIVFLQKLGARAFNHKDFSLAYSFAREAVDLAHNLVDRINQNDTDDEQLCRSLNLLGSISQEQGNQTSAMEAYRESLEVLFRLQTMRPSAHKWMKEISITHEKIADILRKLGDHQGALLEYHQAIAASLTIQADLFDLSWSGQLSQTKKKLGDTLFDQKDYKGALSIYQEILKGKDTTNSIEDYSDVQRKTGRILREQGNLAGSLNAYKAALAIKVDKIRDQLDGQLFRDLSFIYEEIGDLSLEHNLPSDALNAYRKSLVIRTALAEEDSTDATKQRDFNIAREKYRDLLNGQHISPAEQIPLEYRAQATGRCQRQFIKKPKDPPPGWQSDIEQWLDQWVDRIDYHNPFTISNLHTIEVQVNWRLISNSGLDEGVIKPVTGAGGWPLIPGSSIKGLFRRACQKVAPARLIRWCGGTVSTEEEFTLQPGLLRFHGAWPVNDNWTKDLLDIAHPQQEWQVGLTVGKRGGAFGVVSLHQPKLLIGLSCAVTAGHKELFDEKEWDEIMSILRTALEMGIGGRTNAGYGNIGPGKKDLLFECALEGQGPAPKLLNGTAEFRPTMFRAAIRGMALRLFGGVTEARTARQVVGRLFGSISPDDDKDVNVGLLATAYTDASSEIGSFGWNKYRQPTYATSGRLQWRLTRRCETGEDEALLAELLGALHGLTMSLGGFGRGWRRPDHRIFYPGYDKTPIGCHWQWRDTASLPPFIHVQSPADLARLLQTAQRLARRWLDATTRPTRGGPAPWREVIHPARMNIWTRKATGPEDAVAVAWFHSAMEADRETGQPTDPCHLKGSDLAGRMNQVGLIWNRLLPLLTPGQVTTPAKAAQPANPLARPVNPTARPANPMARPPSVARGRPSAGRHPAGQSQGDVSIAAYQGEYLEILVLHALPNNPTPEATQHHQRFIAEMKQGAGADFAPLNWS